MFGAEAAKASILMAVLTQKTHHPPQLPFNRPLNALSSAFCDGAASVCSGTVQPYKGSGKDGGPVRSVM